MAKSAAGAGSIRKKNVKRNGKVYTYWEARITTGWDPATGRQVQRSFTGKTQKEVREKMQAVAVALNTGAYVAPSRMTVAEWLDVWAAEYMGNMKPNTVRVYKINIEKHIKPALGAVKLSALHPHMVQAFVNGLTRTLAPNTVRQAYEVLHHALERAVALEYIPKNPADKCVVPRKQQKEIRPLEDEEAAALLEAASGDELEPLIRVALFTGMRISEALGLTWDAVDLEGGTININKQLNRSDQVASSMFITPKNGEARTIAAAPSVIQALKLQRQRQLAQQLKAGDLWSNPAGLVFTNAGGRYLLQQYVGNHFRKLVAAAGLEGVRFHDLRHTYAVNALRAGDDIKSIQGTLGHSSAAFTLDRYGHFTERMKRDSAARMEEFIKGTMGL